MKKILLPVLSCLVLFAKAQDSLHSLSFTGYAEAYYTYDFNKPADHNRPGFIYSHNRHNEFNLNLGFIKAAYASERARASLALAAGTYMNANYASEPEVLKNIYEANAGFKINKRKNLWLDAGILPSHIGFESAVSKDCPTLTRSILADNSPYYEAGARLTYTTDDGKWLLSALVLNGWQRIQKVDGNSKMSWGTQLQFKPSGRVLLNYSTFLGTDQPDTSRRNRFFHNWYGLFTLNPKLSFTAGFDIGTEQKSRGSKERNTWYSPVGILRYTVSNTWSMAARAEYYRDVNGVIIATGTPNGFRTTGFSFSVDHSPVSNLLVRAEIRNLQSRDNIFNRENKPVRSNTFISSSIAVSF